MRSWRESRHWDVSDMARQLRKAAREAGVDVAALSGLVKMIPRWERGEVAPRERYRLLYERLGYIPPGGVSPGQGPASDAATVAERVEANRKQIAAIREYLDISRASRPVGADRAASLAARFAALPGEDQIRRMAADPEAAIAALRAAASALNTLADILAEGGDNGE